MDELGIVCLGRIKESRGKVENTWNQELEIDLTFYLKQSTTETRGVRFGKPCSRFVKAKGKH